MIRALAVVVSLTGVACGGSTASPASSSPPASDDARVAPTVDQRLEEAKLRVLVLDAALTSEREALTKLEASDDYVAIQAQRDKVSALETSVERAQQTVRLLAAPRR